jgi:hypothetical protein
MTPARAEVAKNIKSAAEWVENTRDIRILPHPPIAITKMLTDTSEAGFDSDILGSHR